MWDVAKPLHEHRLPSPSPGTHGKEYGYLLEHVEHLFWGWIPALHLGRNMFLGWLRGYEILTQASIHFPKSLFTRHVAWCSHWVARESKTTEERSSQIIPKTLINLSIFTRQWHTTAPACNPLVPQYLSYINLWGPRLIDLTVVCYSWKLFPLTSSKLIRA